MGGAITSNNRITTDPTEGRRCCLILLLDGNTMILNYHYQYEGVSGPLKGPLLPNMVVDNLTSSVFLLVLFFLQKEKYTDRQRTERSEEVPKEPTSEVVNVSKNILKTNVR